jgi:hypothetical protein
MAQVPQPLTYSLANLALRNSDARPNNPASESWGS